MMKRKYAKMKRLWKKNSCSNNDRSFAYHAFSQRGVCNIHYSCLNNSVGWNSIGHMHPIHPKCVYLHTQFTPNVYIWTPNSPQMCIFGHPISEFGISQWAKNHGICQRSFGINKNIPGLGPQQKYSFRATSAAEKACLSRMTPNSRMRKWNTKLAYSEILAKPCFACTSNDEGYDLWQQHVAVLARNVGYREDTGMDRWE